MNARTRNRLAAAVAVVAVLMPILIASTGTDAVTRPPPAGAAARSAGATTAPPVAPRTAAPAPPTPAPAATAATAPAAPAESDYLTASSRRWEAPPPGQDGLGNPIALLRDRSCSDSRFLGHSTTLQAVLAEQLGVRDARDRERLFYRKDRRFFQRDGRFHQITANWDNVQPARYRIEWFSAADAALSTDVRAEALPPGSPDQADAIEAREILSALAPAGDTDQERAGSRFLSVDLAASPSTPAVEAGFINGMPFALGFEGGSCRVLASGEAAYCQCNSTSDGGDIHGH